MRGGKRPEGNQRELVECILNAIELFLETPSRLHRQLDKLIILQNTTSRVSGRGAPTNTNSSIEQPTRLHNKKSKIIISQHSSHKPADRPNRFAHKQWSRIVHHIHFNRGACRRGRRRRRGGTTAERLIMFCCPPLHDDSKVGGEILRTNHRHHHHVRRLSGCCTHSCDADVARQRARFRRVRMRRASVR